MTEPPAATIFSLAEPETVSTATATLDGDVAGAEHLDLLALADRALGHEVVDGDVATVREQLGELLEVHDLVLDAERVLEPAQLRQPHVHRHLAALEADAGTW